MTAASPEELVPPLPPQAEARTAQIAITATANLKAGAIVSPNRLNLVDGKIVEAGCYIQLNFT
jgi:hypothetical protein